MGTRTKRRRVLSEWFTIKVKALQILREFGQFDGKFYASDGWLLKNFAKKELYSKKNYNDGKRFA